MNAAGRVLGKVKAYMAEEREAAERERQANRDRLAAEKAQKDAVHTRGIETAELLWVARQAGTLHEFPTLGIQVAGGDVYTIGHSYYEGIGAGGVTVDESVYLGPLAGATAQLTDGTSTIGIGRTAAFGIVGALAKVAKASAIVILADGQVHTHELSGNAKVRAAQVEGVEFSVLAEHQSKDVPGDHPTGSASTPASVGP